MRRRIRRVTGKAGHCAEQPCAGCGDLPKLQGAGAVQGRAVFVRCVLRWQRGRNARARARRNRARTRARGRTMDFLRQTLGTGTGAVQGRGQGRGRTMDFLRQARARAYSGPFCGRRGHGHTAGLFTAGAGAWAHRGSARRGIAAHFGAGVRIGTWRLFSLRQKNNAPSGAMKCTQKEGACSGPRLGLWFSRRLRGLFAAGPLTARNPDFGLSASPGQI